MEVIRGDRRTWQVLLLDITVRVLCLEQFAEKRENQQTDLYRQQCSLNSVKTHEFFIY